MCRRTKGCDRMNHKSKKRWPRKLVAFMACMACMALAFSMVPVGALAAFGESEAVIEALNVVRNTDVKIAKDAPVEQEGDKAEKKEAADKAAPNDKAAPSNEKDAALTTQSDDKADQKNENKADADASNVKDGTAPAEKTDSISAQSDEEGTQVEGENTPSDEAKAFKNAHDAAVAASASGDENELRKQVNLAKELYAALDPAEKEDADIAQMWAAVQNFDKTLLKEDEVVDPIATIGNTGYETLQAALSAAADGATITLSKDLELSTYVSINKSVTLNLNGKTITESGDHVIAVTGGSVTISNGNIALSAGSGTYALSVTGGSLTLQGVSVNGTGASGVLASGGSLVVNGGTSINCANGSGIRVINGAQATMNGGSVNAQNGVFIANQGSAFTMNDGQITGSQYGIVGNGLSQNAGTTINIKGGSVSSSVYIAIFHPQAGTLNVTGGSVQGPLGGIGIKSGTLNISGGTIAGTSSAGYDNTIGSYGNGIMIAGSAIHVDSHSAYAGNLSINISGGTLSSANGYALHEVSDGSSAMSSLSIRGGAFFAAGDVISVTSASSGAVSVSGGRFNHAIPAEYCADGFSCAAADNGFTVTRDYASNVSYADGTDAGSNTIVFDDRFRLEMVSIPDAFDPENGEPTWTWRTSFKVTAPEDMLEDGKTSTYSYIANPYNDDGNSENWVSGGALPEDNVFYIDAIPSQLTGKDQLSYRFAFDWNGDGDIDQYVTAVLKNNVGFADHECDWTEYVVTTEPTCTEVGEEKRQCKVGGEEDARFVDAWGHDWGEEQVDLDPTCEDEGVAHFECTRENCNEELYIDVPAAGHKWEDLGVVLAPTCDAEGLRIWTCLACGEEDDTEIAPTGHSYGNAVVTKDATCTEAGVATATCPACGDTQETVVDALGHKEVAVADKAATCTETGYEGRTQCSVCKEIVNQGTEIAKREHRRADGVTSQEATCTTDGLITFSCPDCGIQLDTERIPAKGHAEITVGAVDPTCTEAGSTGARVCQECNTTLNAASEIPATGHSYGEWTVLTQPQVGVSGIEQRVCTVCDYPDTRDIAALPAENDRSDAPSNNPGIVSGGSSNNNGSADGNGTSGSNDGNGPASSGGTNPGGSPSASGPSDEGTNSNASGTAPNDGAVTNGGNGGTNAQDNAADQGTDENADENEGEQIDDEFTPLASLNSVKQNNDEIDWLLVGIAAGAFVIVDGLAVGLFLAWRRRTKHNL